MNVTSDAPLGDEQRVGEDRGAVGVEVREGLQRQVDRDVGRDVEEGAAGPERAVQGGEPRPARRDEPVQVRGHEVGVLLGGDVEVAEDHAARVEVLPRRRHHDARVVLQHRRGEVAAVPGRPRRRARACAARSRARTRTGPCTAIPRSRARASGARGTRRTRAHGARRWRRAPPAGRRRQRRRRWSSSSSHGRARARPVASYPTEPSICSSIRRFSSTAYSIGSSRVIGSMKPFTIIAVASASDSPRLIR